MATVNKDFKIKSGLVVEGTTGTINGHDILTKKQADQDYIVSLIGGTATPVNTPDTVVKRDGNGDFAAGTVTVNRINIGSVGYIEDDGAIVISNTDNDDIQLYADDIRLNASDDVRLTAQGGDVVISSQTGHTRFVDGPVYIGFPVEPENEVATKGYVDQAESDAVSSANSHTDTALLDYTTTANLDTTIDGYGYLKSADLNGYATESYADQAETDAKAYTDTRETAITTAYQSYADTAEQDAKDYADDLINDASTSSSEVWSAYKTSTEIGLAQAAAELHADEAIADLVNGAPELLDTLNELAAALQDNPDVITDLQDIAAGKQDTLTAGNGIVIDNDDIIYIPTSLGSGISVTPEEVSIDRTTVDTWYDANGSADDAEAAANTYTDGAITTALSTAQGYANTAEQNAKDYADALDTDDVAEGTANLYFTNQRAIDAVGGTIGDQIDLLTTDDIEEGETNLYFSDVRAKTSAAALLTGATKTNIAISGDENGLTITAENGVADSTTDDLAEGATNKYFSDSLALGAIEDANIQPSSIDITWVRREEATWTDVNTASKVTCHSAGTSEGSMKYLVRVTAQVGGVRHSHVTEVLATVAGDNGVAVVEYGTIYTSENPLATVTVEWNSGTSAYDLNVTTANNNSEVMVAATLISALD